jgi:WD40 repeat protein
LWDGDGRLVRLLVGHGKAVSGLVFDETGRRLFSASADGTVRVWEVPTGAEVAALPLAAPPGGLAFAGGRLAVGVGREVRLWDGRPGRERPGLPPLTVAADALALAPDGRTLAVLTCGRRDLASHRETQPGELRLWDVVSKREGLSLVSPSLEDAVSVAFAPDGGRLAVVGWDPERKQSLARVLDPSTGQELVRVLAPRSPQEPGRNDQFVQVAFLPDGGRLALAVSPFEPLRPGAVELREAATGKLVRRCEGPAAAVACLAVSPDGVRIAAGSIDRTVTVWGTEDGAVRQVLQGHEAGVTAVAFGPQGEVASGDRAGVIRVWDTAGKERRMLTGHVGPVAALAFAPDGRLASASWDRTVRVWGRQGEPLLVLQGHDDRVAALAFTPDGRHLWSAGHDRAVRLWYVGD